MMFGPLLKFPKHLILYRGILRQCPKFCVFFLEHLISSLNFFGGNCYFSGIIKTRPRGPPNGPLIKSVFILYLFKAGRGTKLIFY